MNLGKVLGSPTPIDHWSAPARIVASLGREAPGFRVLELGTGYGTQLPHVLPHIGRWVSIDVMYDWVPDVDRKEGIDEGRVDEGKLDGWRRIVEPWDDRTVLLIGNTGESPERFHDELLVLGPFDVMIVDACHHPQSAVEGDFWGHLPFMSESFIAIFDDVHESDPREAAQSVMSRLRGDGHHVDEFPVREGGIHATSLVVDWRSASDRAPWMDTGCLQHI